MGFFDVGGLLTASAFMAASYLTRTEVDAHNGRMLRESSVLGFRSKPQIITFDQIAAI